jgi:Flp pilus assembly protein TadD
MLSAGDLRAASGRARDAEFTRMMTGAIGRLLRLGAVAAIAGLAVGCASPNGPGSITAPAGYGKDPGSRVARLVQYCDRLAEKGELVTALGLCGRAHEIDPDAPEPLLKVAALLQKLDRREAAERTYGALLERHPTHHEALYSLGKLYMEGGEAGPALVQFERATRSDPKDPRPYNAMGILRDQAGEHAAAQGLYRLALERDPANRSVRNNLGLSLALDGKRDEAIEVLAELAVDPEAGQTVMRNLEAAYASRTPAPAPAAPLAEPAAPLADPLDPVASEPLEGTPAADAPGKPAPEPAAPAATGPTPLLPPSGGAGAQQSDMGRPQGASSPAGSSAILAAAEQLMQPPDWADFEPGTLLGAEPAPAAESPAAELPAAEAGNDAGAAVPESAGKVEAFGLSMLVIEAGAAVA